MIIKIDKNSFDYNVIVESNILNNLSKYIDCNRRYFVISDETVASLYEDTILKQLPNCVIHVVESGEKSKSIDVYEKCLLMLAQRQFSRNDTIIALGGGVVGDLAGFVAATYLRGIDFIQIPTTTLSQIDSSIGGKVAINLGGIKNFVGAFKQPKLVLVDPFVLKTLNETDFINGLVEAIKLGIIFDDKILYLFEKNDLKNNLEQIITLSLEIKKMIVEKDPFENDVRKSLNFGHTIGHGIESFYNFDQVKHGEAVAVGILKMINNDEIRNRVIKIYEMLNIKQDISYDKEIVYNYIINDKKINNGRISIIICNEINRYEIKDIKIEEIKKYM